MKLRLHIFTIFLILFSCNEWKENKLENGKIFEVENARVTKSYKEDLFVTDSIKISGYLSLEDIECLYVYIENKSKFEIQLDNSYYIASNTLMGKQKEIFRENQNYATVIKQGERKKIRVNLRLDKIKYSSNVPYSFNIFYKIKNINDNHFDLSYQFYTPTMWKESNGSITLMLDTIINN